MYNLSHSMKKIPSEMEVAPRYTVYTAYTVDTVDTVYIVFTVYPI